MNCKKHITASQKAMLLQFMEENPQLVKQRVSNQYTNVDIKKSWVGISNKLNSIPGASKSWQEWRKCWSDMKSRSKKKQAQKRRSINQTGGGPPEKNERDTMDEKVLDIIGGDLLISGVGVEESSLPWEFNGEISQSEIIVEDHCYTRNVQFGKNVNEAEKEPEVEIPIQTFDSTKEENEKVYCKTATVITRPPLKKRSANRSNTALKKKNNLSASIEASNELIRISKDQSDLKKEYYSEKLALLEKQNMMLERIAVAVENISNVLTRPVR